jgi:hypothetical protein
MPLTLGVKHVPSSQPRYMWLQKHETQGLTQQSQKVKCMKHDGYYDILLDVLAFNLKEL